MRDNHHPHYLSAFLSRLPCACFTSFGTPKARSTDVDLTFSVPLAFKAFVFVQYALYRFRKLLESNLGHISMEVN